MPRSNIHENYESYQCYNTCKLEPTFSSTQGQVLCSLNSVLTKTPCFFTISPSKFSKKFWSTTSLAVIVVTNQQPTQPQCFILSFHTLVTQSYLPWWVGKNIFQACHHQLVGYLPYGTQGRRTTLCSILAYFRVRPALKDNWNISSNFIKVSKHIFLLWLPVKEST